MRCLAIVLLFIVAVWAVEHGPFTEDFITFLKRKPTEKRSIVKEPVIFVHGQADSALSHKEPFAKGWTKAVEHFKEKGHKSSELYGITYGTRDVYTAGDNRISCKDILSLRRLIKAVLEYTKSEKIDIVVHSTGVSLARKAIYGGTATLSGETCTIGDSLVGKIDSLVGLAGANYGMCLCFTEGLADKAACSPVDGFHPGTCGLPSTLTREQLLSACTAATSPCETVKNDYSKVLKQINAEADDGPKINFIASVYTKNDAVIGADSKVWGRRTAVIPGSDFEFEFDDKTHWELKDSTAPMQYALVTKHRR